MDSEIRRNRAIWEMASQKYIREYDEHLERARAQSSLDSCEREILGPLLASAPVVVHLQSGNGLDDTDLVAAGGRRVDSVDYSQTAVTAAQSRAHELSAPCRYVIGLVPATPFRDQCADLVYTGKGALIWMQDITAWAAEVARLLRPGGHLFVYDQHPMVPLWTWETDVTNIRTDRSYFGRSYHNDSFPGGDATEWQWTLGQIVTAVAGAGLEVHHLAEYPEPFWRFGDTDAAAWRGQLPNTFSLLAQRRS